MKYFLMFILFFLFSKADAQDVIYIPKYIRYQLPDDSVKFEIKEFSKKSLYFKGKNQDPIVWKNAAIDSALYYGGNVVKVKYSNPRLLFFQGSKNIEAAMMQKSMGYWAKIYKINENELTKLKDSVLIMENKVKELQSKNLLLLLEPYNTDDEKIESLLYKKQDRIESRKDTHPVLNKDFKESRIYVGLTSGMDFALHISAGLQTELNLIKNKNFDISIGDKVNGMFGFALIFQNYYYASTKLRLGKIWLQPSYGKEYYYLSGGEGYSRKYRQDRIDLDFYWLTFRKQRVGFSIPFRLNSEFDGFPWYGFYVRGELGNFIRKNKK